MLGIRNEKTAMGNNGNSAPVATNSPLSAPSTQVPLPQFTAAQFNDIDDNIPFQRKTAKNLNLNILLQLWNWVPVLAVHTTKMSIFSILSNIIDLFNINFMLHF